MSNNQSGIDKFFQELATYTPITLKLGALVLHNKYIYGAIEHGEDVHWLMHGIDDGVQWGLIILSVPTVLNLFYKVLIKDFIIPILKTVCTILVSIFNFFVKFFNPNRQ